MSDVDQKPDLPALHRLAQLAREAGELTEKSALHGYDAVHLASALSAGDAGHPGQLG
jgi:predicted nucleic acid-binding protein